MIPDAPCPILSVNHPNGSSANDTTFTTALTACPPGLSHGAAICSGPAAAPRFRQPFAPTGAGGIDGAAGNVVATGTVPSDNGAVVVVNGNVGGGPCVNTASGSVGATVSAAGFSGSKINPDPSVE